MMKATMNIVELIEKNPITKLSNVYQSKLLLKIQKEFTELEQQLFVSSFYCYLNYHKTNDFVIDLDDVWKWIGFAQKVKAKSLLEKHFTIDIDYKLLLSQPGKQTECIRGGHNKETFVMTVKTFKSFCMKASTKRAEEIHEYYIKLEETLQDICAEETDELKQQIQCAEQKIECSETDKSKLREKTIIEQFPINTQCLYYGIIDNVSDNNEKLVKFGISNNLKGRVAQHHKTYLNFRLVNAFRVQNNTAIENAVKQDESINARLRTIVLCSKKYIEIISIEDLSFVEFDKTIKGIISEVEYSYQNYIKLQQENHELKQQIVQLNVTSHKNECTLLTIENKRIQSENKMLIKRSNTLSNKTQKHCNHTIIGADTPLCSSTNIIATLKRPVRNKNGKYDINGILYDNLFGKRPDVWSGEAYKTTGCLTKNNLMVNHNGDIVSKTKSIQETQRNRFNLLT